MTNGNDSIFIAKGVTLDGIGYINKQGLTKRELFAAMAMCSLIEAAGENYYEPTITAKTALDYTNALIEQLNKEVQS
jgi:hypothetical protein